MVDSATSIIYNRLIEEFPVDKYRNNISPNYGKIDKKMLEYFNKKCPPSCWLKKRLITALNHDKPLVITFAPMEVKGQNEWSWKSTFIEIAGKSVEFDYMTPEILKPSGELYSFPSGSSARVLKKKLQISAFGRETFDWSCYGDFDHCSASLNFRVSAETKDYFQVSSYTLLINSD